MLTRNPTTCAVVVTDLWSRECSIALMGGHVGKACVERCASASVEGRVSTRARREDAEELPASSNALCRPLG